MADVQVSRTGNEGVDQSSGMVNEQVESLRTGGDGVQASASGDSGQWTVE